MVEPLRFYCNGETDDLKWEQISNNLNHNDNFLDTIMGNPEYARTLLPSSELEQGGQDYALLREHKEPASRYHALVLTLLHRLGYKLADPTSGAFEILQTKDSVARHLHSDLVSNVGAQLQRTLFAQIVDSLAVCGFYHYATQLYNSIARSFYAGNIAGRMIRQWYMQHLVMDMSELTKHYAARARNVVLTNVAPPDTPVPPITSAAVKQDNTTTPVPCCRHGILMITSASREWACVATKASAGDCNARAPIR